MPMMADACFYLAFWEVGVREGKSVPTWTLFLPSEVLKIYLKNFSLCIVDEASWNIVSMGKGCLPLPKSQIPSFFSKFENIFWIKSSVCDAIFHLALKHGHCLHSLGRSQFNFTLVYLQMLLSSKLLNLFLNILCCLHIQGRKVGSK